MWNILFFLIGSWKLERKANTDIIWFNDPNILIGKYIITLQTLYHSFRMYLFICNLLIFNSFLNCKLVTSSHKIGNFKS